MCMCVCGKGGEGRGTHFASLTSKYNEAEVWRQSTCTHAQEHGHLTITQLQFKTHNNGLARDEGHAWYWLASSPGSLRREPGDEARCWLAYHC